MGSTTMPANKFNLHRGAYCFIITAILLFLVKLVTESSFYADSFRVLKNEKFEPIDHYVDYKQEEGNKINAFTIHDAVVDDYILENTSQKSKDEMKQLKYILQWTSPNNVPFVYMGKGQKTFIENKCKYTNCYVTGNRQFLDNDYTNFDAVVFAGPEVAHLTDLPKKRSPKQKFVFASIESAHNYPVCSEVFNNFFNWTWTYRLDSDSKWGYIVIRDSKGIIIGPKNDMQWIKPEDMQPVTREFRGKLELKTKAIAWFVSNCHTISGRERYVSKMEMEIKQLGFPMSIDKYGKCGRLKCDRNNELCEKMVEKDYFFYLAFENSFSEDYVTEKLIHAVGNKAIPVVYGGANYSRFLPPGSYLNARELTPKELVTKIYELMNDIDKYTEYFRWTNHYTYHRRRMSVETDDYCGQCALLNDAQKVRETTVYHNFVEWWNDSPEQCHR